MSLIFVWGRGNAFPPDDKKFNHPFFFYACPEHSERHVDMMPLRVSREHLDVEKLQGWFSKHPPFLESKQIVSLTTGKIGYEEVNCHTAQKIGTVCMKNIVGQTFEIVKQKRKDKVYQFPVHGQLQ